MIVCECILRGKAAAPKKVEIQITKFLMSDEGSGESDTCRRRLLTEMTLPTVAHAHASLQPQSPVHSTKQPPCYSTDSCNTLIDPQWPSSYRASHKCVLAPRTCMAQCGGRNW